MMDWPLHGCSAVAAERSRRAGGAARGVCHNCRQ
jgi:hypothetical protein